MVIEERHCAAHPRLSAFCHSHSRCSKHHAWGDKSLQFPVRTSADRVHWWRHGAFIPRRTTTMMPSCFCSCHLLLPMKNTERLECRSNDRSSSPMCRCFPCFRFRVQMWTAPNSEAARWFPWERNSSLSNWEERGVGGFLSGPQEERDFVDGSAAACVPSILSSMIFLLCSASCSSVYATERGSEVADSTLRCTHVEVDGEARCIRLAKLRPLLPVHHRTDGLSCTADWRRGWQRHHYGRSQGCRPRCPTSRRREEESLNESVLITC
jgi:hypothetical protein